MKTNLQGYYFCACVYFELFLQLANRKLMKSSLNRKDFIVAVFHSLAFYAIAFLLIWFLTSLTTVIIANSLDIPTIWRYFRIDFMIPQSQWNHDLVKITFSGGPITSLFFGILCLIAYYNVMNLNGILKMLFLWGFIHGWTGFFGSLFIGTLTSTGFGHVVIWLYFNDTARLTTNLFSLLMLFFGGFIIARPVLISANYYLNNLPETSRTSFLVAQMILPALIGMGMFVVLRAPASLEDQLLPFTGLLMILPVFMRRHHFSIIYFDDDEIEVRPEWIYLIIAALMIAAYRIIFEFGIRSGF